MFNLFNLFKQPKPRHTYVITSLGGTPMNEGEIREQLSEAASNKVFRATVQMLEQDLQQMREMACDPDRLKDGTQPHFNGGADALNGALVRIAQMVESGQRGKTPATN